MTTLPFTADLTLTPEVTAFFDAPTNTISYVVKDPNSNACAVIDSVMDIDYAAGRITYDGADTIIRHIEEHQLKLEWLIETHVHADHLSAAPYIQGKLGGNLGSRQVQQEWPFSPMCPQRVILGWSGSGRAVVRRCCASWTTPLACACCWQSWPPWWPWVG
jgi:hypothetical protein